MHIQGACADLISLRSSAIRLLICFMGAALQSLYAVTALVEYTFDAYRYVCGAPCDT